MKTLEILSQDLGMLEIVTYEDLNKEYEGLILTCLHTNLTIRSRLAKLTSKKKGYFVSFWEKDMNNTNQPFHAGESPEYLAIVISDENRRGYFMIPKDVAVDKHIYTLNHIKGKMGMRFYPSWCDGLNATAKKKTRMAAEIFC